MPIASCIASPYFAIGASASGPASMAMSASALSRRTSSSIDLSPTTAWPMRFALLTALSGVLLSSAAEESAVSFCPCAIWNQPPVFWKELQRTLCTPSGVCTANEPVLSTATRW